MLVSASKEEGVLEADEQEMLYNVFDFAETNVDEVMVPRPDVVGLHIGLTPAEAAREVLRHPYTRYPVYREDLDEICGILHIRSLFDALQNGGAAATSLDGARAVGPARAGDEAPRQAPRRVPPHVHAHGGRRRRVRLDGGDRDPRGPDRGDRRRDRRRVRPPRRLDPAAREGPHPRRRLVPDRGVQRALRGDLRGGLRLARRLRVRRARARAAPRATP